MSEAREGLASGQYLPIVRTAFGSLNCSLVRRSAASGALRSRMTRSGLPRDGGGLIWTGAGCWVSGCGTQFSLLLCLSLFELDRGGLA
jgi:hypothetical protein